MHWEHWKWPESNISPQVGVSLVGEGRVGDTYVDLCLANVFSLMQRDENKGCKGHIFLPGVLEATLEEKRGSKDRVTSVFTCQPTPPIGSMDQGRAGSLPIVSPEGGPGSLVFIHSS